MVRQDRVVRPVGLVREIARALVVAVDELASPARGRPCRVELLSPIFSMGNRTLLRLGLVERRAAVLELQGPCSRLPARWAVRAGGGGELARDRVEDGTLFRSSQLMSSSSARCCGGGYGRAEDHPVGAAARCCGRRTTDRNQRCRRSRRTRTRHPSEDLGPNARSTGPSATRIGSWESPPWNMRERVVGPRPAASTPGTVFCGGCDRPTGRDHGIPWADGPCGVVVEPVTLRL